MTLARIETYEEMMCLTHAVKGSNQNIFSTIYLIKRFKISSASPNPEKWNHGTFQVNGLNFGAPSFPTWFPGKIPVDMFLFGDNIVPSPNSVVGFVIDSTFPVIMPFLEMKQNPYGVLLCEDL